MPYEEDLPYLFTDPARVRAQAYDFVLNGIELGSGSVRIHRQEVQQKMFEALGFDEETIEERFGFLVSAFQYGTPPHAGFAFGLDRLVMLLVGADSLREVIAFPKVKDASCPLTSAPTPVDRSQLEILNLIGESFETTSHEKRKKNQTSFDIDRVADLACLSLSQEEKETYSADLQDMVHFAASLSKIPTEGVAPSSYTVAAENVFREDIPESFCDRDELLKNAKTKNDEFVYVPGTSL
jgi:aspartyl-tRNA synthetase